MYGDTKILRFCLDVFCIDRINCRAKNELFWMKVKWLHVATREAEGCVKLVSSTVSTLTGLLEAL